MRVSPSPRCTRSLPPLPLQRPLREAHAVQALRRGARRRHYRPRPCKPSVRPCPPALSSAHHSHSLPADSKHHRHVVSTTCLHCAAPCVIPTPPVLDADARVQAAAAPVPDAMAVDHQEPPSTSATSTTAVPLSPLPLHLRHGASWRHAPAAAVPTRRRTR